MTEAIVALGQLPERWQKAVLAEIQRRLDAEREEMFRDITALPREEHRTVDGLGRVALRVHPTSYHYWGQRLGYECWRDKQFLREYERDNEYARVERAPKAMVTVPAGSQDGLVAGSSGAAPSRERKFRKVYPC